MISNVGIRQQLKRVVLCLSIDTLQDFRIYLLFRFYLRDLKILELVISDTIIIANQSDALNQFFVILAKGSRKKITIHIDEMGVLSLPIDIYSSLEFLIICTAKTDKPQNITIYLLHRIFRMANLTYGASAQNTNVGKKVCTKKHPFCKIIHTIIFPYPLFVALFSNCPHHLRISSQRNGTFSTFFASLISFPIQQSFYAVFGAESMSVNSGRAHTYLTLPQRRDTE